jgi:S-adenosylmethionine synthetase
MPFLFSSESVSEGHPDKLCDQISDAILDACLTQDPESRVAAECFATTGLVIVGGEITSKAVIDIRKIVRNTLKEVGYTKAEYGIESETCGILTTLNEQSPDIAQGVNKGEGKFTEMGAGDQGLMFGYACNQTPELMPMTLSLSHKLVQKVAELRKAGTLSYLRPDSKAQVTLEYEDDNTPKRAHTIVISTQHGPEVEWQTIHDDMVAHVIHKVVPAYLIDSQTRIFINPTGSFIIGGPNGDAGLTGRKIIVDTYGGWGGHGGGAFSGKDPSKVDRSAAYMARYIAKNLVAANLAKEIELQLAYAIGVAEPVSVRINSYGTAVTSDRDLEDLVKRHFKLTPEGIIDTLNLKRPIYRQVAAYGHFGRTDVDVPWEKTDKADLLASFYPTASVLNKDSNAKSVNHKADRISGHSR